MKKIKYIVDSFKRKYLIPIYKISNNDLLHDKVALVVGGSGGIGFAIAKKFIANGCKVIIAGTNPNKLEELKSKINDCNTLVVNLLDIKNIDSVINNAFAVYGRIDILVMSSGIHTVRPNFNFLNVSEDEYDAVMDVNIKGTFFTCQTVAKKMIDCKINGHILIISSQSALEPSWSPYRLSKRALSGMIQGLGQALLPYNIIVNAIGPGPTATSMQICYENNNIETNDNPIGRFTMPEEIAEYALLMASQLGDTIVGDTLYMSGGRGIIEIR